MSRRRLLAAVNRDHIGCNVTPMYEDRRQKGWTYRRCAPNPDINYS